MATLIPDPHPEHGSDDGLASSSAELVLRLQQSVAARSSRSQEAWSDLVERYRARLLRTAERLLGPKLRRLHDAEDILNEAWMRAANDLKAHFSYRGPASLYRWLQLQVRRVILDKQRIQSRRPTGIRNAADMSSSSHAPEIPDDARGPVSTACNKERMKLALAALETLPEIYRRALKAVDIDERDRNEVAAEFGIVANTLTWQLKRGRDLWRRAIEEARRDGTTGSSVFRSL